VPHRSPTKRERNDFLRALYARLGPHSVHEKTTVVEFVGRDLGWDDELTRSVVDALVSAGLVTAPTKEGAFGLTTMGVGVARRRTEEGDERADEDE
jgi:hypothetical protein